MTVVVTGIRTFPVSPVSGETVFVERNAALITSFEAISTGFIGTVAFNTILVEGQVVSTGNIAVLLDNINPGSGNHTLVVGEEGALRSGRNFVSAVVSGPDCLVQNFGLISGDGGFWGQAWSGGVLENYGTIAGQRFAGVR
ncbi:MAG: hypothetical protein K2X74_02155, partial [Acetobacteraceae bacterium]|nr:hypothetical protein [Acetobacteraceae bacterium]